jgi:hypothetical protein
VLAFCNCTALHGGTCPGHAGKTGDSTQQIEDRGLLEQKSSRAAGWNLPAKISRPREPCPASSMACQQHTGGAPFGTGSSHMPPLDLNILLVRRAATLMLSCCSSMPSHQLQMLEGAAANLAGERPGLII